MGKIKYAAIERGYSGEYKIGCEHYEAEFGDEWAGDVSGYVENMLENIADDDMAMADEMPEGTTLDKGSAYGSRWIYILRNGSPIAAYWLADE